MTAIYLVSGSSDAPGPGAGWDKLAHAAVYCVLGLLCLRACHGGLGPLRTGPTLLALLLALGYGAFDELHQSRVPGRDASIADWVADAAGVMLALPGARLLGKTDNGGGPAPAAGRQGNPT